MRSRWLWLSAGLAAIPLGAVPLMAATVRGVTLFVGAVITLVAIVRLLSRDDDHRREPLPGMGLPPPGGPYIGR